MTTKSIYERAVPINKARHREYSVKIGRDYGFAKSMNAVPIVTGEFEVAALQYPIIFSKSGDKIQPLALVGLRDDENFFVSEDGSWTGDYIPALMRRYPFVFSHEEDSDKYVLCIDEAFGGVNVDGNGDSLFDADGEATEFLKRAIGFTTSYQKQMQDTRVLMSRLADLDVFSPAEVKFSVDGHPAALRGMMMVDREKLSALTPDQLWELSKAGDLEKLYAHLISLRNIDRLGAKLKKS
jgi:hypothetical protein